MVTPQKTIEFRSTPLVLVFSLLTHLFGGSAGREGTAVQMGASLADQFNPWFKMTIDRKLLLTAGVAAGFSSLFATPLAAIVFALTLVPRQIRTYNFYHIIFISACSFGANFVCHLTQAKHYQYPVGQIISPNLAQWPVYIICCLLFGLCGWFFAYSLKKIPNILNNFLGKNILLHSLVISLSLIALHLIVQRTEVLGLGLSTIAQAFLNQVMWDSFALKLIFTLLTLSAGLKGGEVTPLFFIGACLGASLSNLTGLDHTLLVGVGFITLFSACAKTPMACILMGAELFGMEFIPYLIISCYLTHIISPKISIYPAQYKI
jgi:H+/Cl- antiporter ClcA